MTSRRTTPPGEHGRTDKPKDKAKDKAKDSDMESEQLNFTDMISLKNWGAPPRALTDEASEAVVDCGWGRLLFGQTFLSPADIAAGLRKEQAGQRDVALYIRDPQVVLAHAPQELFIDPSLTFRLALARAIDAAPAIPGVAIVPMVSQDETAAINRIYQSRGMVPLRPDYELPTDQSGATLMLLAVDGEQGQVIGCVTGVDHRAAFGDPDNGSSLWALAVDPQCSQPGIGRALVLELARRFQERGRAFMDLSVMHDNREAITLYEALGFEQVPVYCVKRKNAINEPLFTGPRPDDALNPYARIITEEALRRGIAVEVIDAPSGLFRLSLGGRVVSCRESLTDATSAVALARCDDKALTHRLLGGAGLRVPGQAVLADEADALRFLERYQRVVIKPARGEQGAAVAVDLREPEEVSEAFREAAAIGETVLAEEYVEGEDLRIIVINNELVAAALRRPATIVGTGRHSIADLIEKQSRRRSAATGGESRIPVDGETLRCVAQAGFSLEDVLPAGTELAVRKTANLHTGGTLHDVTHELHPRLEEVALEAARVLDIPVLGLDLIVSAPESFNYVIIEANERPGLANHEPQPTAEKLLDFLFPATAGQGGSA
jgi:GNAT-family acetyltransferase (TIGR03103 family)